MLFSRQLFVIGDEDLVPIDIYLSSLYTIKKKNI